MQRIQSLVVSTLMFLAAPAFAQLPIPADLQPGDEYQLLFRSAGTHTAQSADIDVYNAWIQTVADEAGFGASIGVTWKVIASTATVHAKDNAIVDAPVYNIRPTGPERLADGYDDMWDGALKPDVLLVYTEKGGEDTSDVWTGSLWTGEGAPGLTLGSPALAFCGNPRPPLPDDWINFLPPPVFSGLGMYALSEVLVVPVDCEATPEDPECAGG